MPEIGCLTEDIINNFVLNHLEGDYPSDKRKGWLIFFIERLDFEQGAQWVLFLTFVELLIETELILLLEDAVGEVERLGAVLSVRDRPQIIAKSAFILLRVWVEVNHATRFTDHSRIVLVGCHMVVGRVVLESSEILLGRNG